jgi:hypothetical protein
MPAHAGTWISDGGRARRLLTEELAKAIGVPKNWGDLEKLDPRPLGWQTCSHVCEWLGNVLAAADADSKAPAMPNGIREQADLLRGLLSDARAAPDPLSCTVGHKGFRFDDGTLARPCDTRYHYGCVRLGALFTTRF